MLGFEAGTQHQSQYQSFDPEHEQDETTLRNIVRGVCDLEHEFVMLYLASLWSMHRHITFRDGVFDGILWRRIASEELKLGATLFNQDLERFDTYPALVSIIMGLL